MVNSRIFTAYLRNGLWAEAAITAMLLKNNLIIHNRNISPFQQFLGKEKRSILASSQTFGEISNATYTDNSHLAKLAEWGTPGIWVGFAESHQVGTYSMYNPKTKKIILIKDVTFLKKSYGDYDKIKNLDLST